MSWPQNWVQQPTLVPAVPVVAPTPAAITSTTSLAYGTMTPEQYSQQQNW